MNHIEFYRGAVNPSDCISNGWNLVKQNYGLFFGISIVALLMVTCIPCLNIFIAGPVMGGVYYCFLKEMRREPVSFGEMFKGFETFVPAMVVGLISMIPGVIAQILRLTVNLADLGLKSGNRDYFQSNDTQFVLAGGLLVFAIIGGLVFFLLSVALHISLFFALPLIVEHKLGAVDAMKLSAQAAWANVGGLILLFLLEIVVALIGVLALCIGILFVIPIIYAANAFAYRQVFPNLGQNFQTAPPPPNAYGGTYGVGQ
ncbi:MAG: hypothetical protein H0W77_06825 [Acidobacteria bacterium]|nr:hypothetical protein [Acidobacteriota bacterium]